RLRSSFRLLALLHFEGEAVFILLLVIGDQNRVSIAEVGAQDLLGHRVFDVLLDGAAQRPCPELGIKALVNKEILGGLRKLDLESEIPSTLQELISHDVDDLEDVLLLERVEDDDIVDTIEKLRVED